MTGAGAIGWLVAIVLLIAGAGLVLLALTGVDHDHEPDVDEYFDDVKAIIAEPGHGRQRRVVVLMPAALYEQLDKAAARTGISRPRLVVDALCSWLPRFDPVVADVVLDAPIPYELVQ